MELQFNDPFCNKNKSNIPIIFSHSFNSPVIIKPELRAVTDDTIVKEMEKIEKEVERELRYLEDKNRQN
ncbi:MAG: hypothetical protein AAF298_00315 [Cyanobacteria bacterium P01_A01_bin.40]